MDTNRIVLITGGTSGIGLGAIAYLLKKGGYQVISLSRNEKRAQEAQEKLGDLGNDVDFLLGDVSDERDLARLYEGVEKKYGRLDGLVSGAGIIKLGGVETQTIEDWDRLFAVNLRGPFLLVKTFLPLLKKGRNASIVNISSMASQRVGGSIAYSASKAGLDALTKYLAQELGKYQIRVNSINPGAVYTNIYVASGDYTQKGYDQWSEKKAPGYPLGRIGRPEDLAPAIEFLLSELSLWQTGDIILVDGGKSI